jgi:centromeric protein E
VYVAGVHEEIVTSVPQILALMDRGEANRHVGETAMNARSSRSHTIFRMVVEVSGERAEKREKP